MYSLISGTQQSFCHFDQEMQLQQRSTVEQRLIFPLRFALRTFRAKSCTLANCDRRWKAQLICRTLRSQFAQFSWQPIACQTHFSCFASPGSPWMMQEFFCLDVNKCCSKVLQPSLGLVGWREVSSELTDRQAACWDAFDFKMMERKVNFMSKGACFHPFVRALWSACLRQGFGKRNKVEKESLKPTHLFAQLNVDSWQQIVQSLQPLNTETTLWVPTRVLQLFGSLFKKESWQRFHPEAMLCTFSHASVPRMIWLLP